MSCSCLISFRIESHDRTKYFNHLDHSSIETVPNTIICQPPMRQSLGKVMMQGHDDDRGKVGENQGNEERIASKVSLEQ